MARSDAAAVRRQPSIECNAQCAGPMIEFDGASARDEIQLYSIAGDSSH
jgi:hypothetical protein